MASPYTPVKQLHATVTGSGPVVVLLHGYLSTSRYWDAVTDALQIDHTVVAIDLLGFGASPKPRLSKYNYNDQIASILYTLELLQLSKPCTFVGHSMGALIALRLSRRYPRRVAKLVLVNPPVMLGKSEVTTEIYGTSKLYRYGLNPLTHRFIWPLFRGLFYSGALPKKTKLWLQRSPYIFQHSAASRIRSFRNVIMKNSIDSDLALTSIPTIILSGINDRPIYRFNLSHLPLSTSVEQIEIAAGHHIPLFAPQALVDVLRTRWYTTK